MKPKQRGPRSVGPALNQDSVPERVPPHALDAEMSVLGALLQDHAAFVAVRAILLPEDFYRHAHGRIFAAACDVADQRGEQVDLVTVTNELRRAGTLEEVGSAAYLSSLVAAVPTAANVAHHARIVKEKSQARQVIIVAKEVVELASRDDGWRPAVAKLVDITTETARERGDQSLGMITFLQDPGALEWDIQHVRVRGDSGWTGGAPKSMKGLLSLEEARACATGTPFIGHFATRQVRVLYVSQEDRRERIHRRIHEMMRGRPPEEIPSGQWLRFLIKAGVGLDTTDGIEVLRAHIDRFRPQIVFLEHFDILTKAVVNRSEEVKPILSVLDQLRDEFDVVFRVQKHHRKESLGQSSRKGEMLGGSQSLFGWGESSVYLTLLRRGAAQVECEAKDGDTTARFLVEYRDGKLVYAGEVGDRKARRHEAVLDFLGAHPEATTAKVAAALGRTERTAGQVLRVLEREGLVTGRQESSRQAKHWSVKPLKDNE